MVEDFPLVFAPMSRDNCRVLLETGRIVSHAGLWLRELVFHEARLKVGLLASVATDPSCRGRGFAAQAVGALEELMRDQGCDLGILWTAVPDFYAKRGWEIVTPHGVKGMMSTARLSGVSPGGFVIRPFDAATDLAAVMELHDREPIRMTRSADEYRRLLALPKVDTWVALGDDCVVAYGAHGRACNKQGLIEYGGLLAGIAAIALHVVSHLPADGETPLLAYPVRPELIEWLRRLGLPEQPLVSSKGMANEMIQVFRPERIPASLREELFIWGLEHV